MMKVINMPVKAAGEQEGDGNKPKIDKNSIAVK